MFCFCCQLGIQVSIISINFSNFLSFKLSFLFLCHRIKIKQLLCLKTSCLVCRSMLDVLSLLVFGQNLGCDLLACLLSISVFICIEKKYVLRNYSKLSLTVFCSISGLQSPWSFLLRLQFSHYWSCAVISNTQ